jgi:hypothetical protein
VLCLSVEVNGEASILAGDAFAETITASVDLFPGVSDSWLRVSGDVVPDDAPAADAKWLGQALNVGDVVVIRLVESDTPTAPTLSRSDLSLETTDGVKLVCSFCGKSHMDIQKMYAGTKAVICNECVGFLHQMAVEDGV